MSFHLELSEQDEQYLKEIARLSILESLQNKPVNYPEPPSEVLKQKLGAFVTLKRAGRLRGCIGQIIGQKPLYLTIIEMAKAAAFNDPRFEPLQAEELDDLDIEISILGPLERIEGMDQIEIGKHGLLIYKDGHSGLLLPQVATEWGWDAKTFLEQTCLKAGLEPECYLDPNAQIYRFEAKVF